MHAYYHGDITDLKKIQEDALRRLNDRRGGEDSWIHLHKYGVACGSGCTKASQLQKEAEKKMLEMEGKKL